MNSADIVLVANHGQVSLVLSHGIAGSKQTLLRGRLTIEHNSNKLLFQPDSPQGTSYNENQIEIDLENCYAAHLIPSLSGDEGKFRPGRTTARSSQSSSAAPPSASKSAFYSAQSTPVPTTPSTSNYNSSSDEQPRTTAFPFPPLTPLSLPASADNSLESVSVTTGHNQKHRYSIMSLASGKSVGSRISLSKLGRIRQGVSQTRSSNCFCVFGVDIPHKRPLDINKRPQLKCWRFFVEAEVSTGSLSGDSIASNWVYEIRQAMQNNTPSALPDRKLLVLINPFGGRKLAMCLYESCFKPMMELAGVEHVVESTQYAGHAHEIAKKLELSKYSAIVTISGDGLFHEMLNGLMERSDWKEAMKLALGIVPAGSGNALAKSIDTIYPEVATLNIIKRHCKPFDIFAYRYLNKPEMPIRFGFVEVLWALVADIDLESDIFRWAGSARFTLMAIIRLISLRKYRGKLFYLPSSAVIEHSSEGTEQSNLFKFIDNIDPLNLSAEWKSITTNFSYFMAMNIPWCSHDFLPAPKCRISDGSLNLVWIEQVSRIKLLKLLLDTESGNYINETFVKSEHVRAFILDPQPLSEKYEGNLDVDGEKVPYAPLIVESLPSIARLIVPRTIN